MAGQTPATRAQLFMRQCRNRQTFVLTQSITRAVSSSHLAPSNFSKPLRARDLPSEQQEERRLPGRNRPSRHSQFQTQIQTQSSSSSPGNLPPPVVNIWIPGGFISYMKYRVLKFPLPKRPVTHPPFNVLNNPYKARKSWPPDFRLLHPKQQFHFEKLYRRRLLARTISMRYDWNRYTKLLQQTLIVITLLYFLFIADPYAPEGGGTPVDGFRAWFFGKVANLEAIPRDTREQAAELAEYYKNNWKLMPFNVLKEQAEEDARREEQERLAASPVNADVIVDGGAKQGTGKKG